MAILSPHAIQDVGTRMRPPRTTGKSPSPKVRIEALAGPWTRRLVLTDGRVVWLRPIEPADAEPIRQTFSLLSPDEVRLRFLHPIKELAVDAVRRLTDLDRTTQFALVIAEPLPPGAALVGAVSRLAIDSDHRHAEFAIIVSRFLSGNGLGRLLMRRLIRWARLKRLESIYGDVLDENTAMLHLAKALGFRREPLPDEPGLIRVRLNLGQAGQ